MNLMTASTQWATRPADQRFETLEALRESVHGRRLRSRSTDLDINRIEAKSEGEALVLNGEITPSVPSHWAFGQLAATIKAPASYLRTLPSPMVADLINLGIKQNPVRDQVKFMTVVDADGSVNTIQAVTSTTYGRIWDADVVDAVGRVVDRSGGKFHNPLAYARDTMGGHQAPAGLYASDHDVFCFMIDGGSMLEAGDRAKLHRGFIAWNSEVGARKFGLMTFLFNAICGNHIIWGAQDVNQLMIRHSSGGPARFDAQAAPMLQAFTEASEAPVIDVVTKAQGFLLAEKEEDLIAWGRGKSFTKNEVTSAIAFAKSEEGECRTLWQFVQGATAYARGYDFIDARVDLERRAGSLLDLVSGK